MWSKLKTFCRQVLQRPIVKRFFFMQGFMSALMAFQVSCQLLGLLLNKSEFFPNMVEHDVTSLSLLTPYALFGSIACFFLAGVRRISLRAVFLFTTICVVFVGFPNASFTLLFLIYLGLLAWVCFGELLESERP